MSFKGQGQIQLKCVRDIATNVNISKYEDNPLQNNKVIVNNSKIQAHYAIICHIQGP